MGSDELITGLAVVSARADEDSTEPSVVLARGGSVGGEVLPVSVNVLDSSEVEASVSGLEERRVAVLVELVVGIRVEVSIGVEEVGRAGDRVAVTPMGVISAKSWDNEMQRVGGERLTPWLCWGWCSVTTAVSSPRNSELHISHGAS